MHKTATPTQNTVLSVLKPLHAVAAGQEKPRSPAMKYSTPSSSFSPAPASALHPSQLEASRTGFDESGAKVLLSNGRSCRTERVRTVRGRSQGMSHVFAVCWRLRYRTHADLSKAENNRDLPS